MEYEETALAMMTMLLAASCYFTIGLVLLTTFCEVWYFQLVPSQYNKVKQGKRRMKQQYDKNERNKVMVSTTSYSLPIQSSSTLYSTSPVTTTTTATTTFSSILSYVSYNSIVETILSCMRLAILSSLSILLYLLFKMGSFSTNNNDKDHYDSITKACMVVFWITFACLLILKRARQFTRGEGEKHVRFHYEKNYKERDDYYSDDWSSNSEEEGGELFNDGGYHGYDNDHHEQKRRLKKEYQKRCNAPSPSSSSVPLEGWEDLMNSNNKYFDKKKEEEDTSLFHDEASIQQVKDLFHDKFGMELPGFRQKTTSTRNTMLQEEEEGEEEQDQQGINNLVSNRKNMPEAKQRFLASSSSLSSLPPEIQAIASRRPDLVKMFLDAEDEKASLPSPDDFGSCTDDNIGDINSDQYDDKKSLIPKQQDNHSTPTITTSQGVNASMSIQTPTAATASKNYEKISLSSSATKSSPHPLSDSHPLFESMPPHIKEIALRRPDLLSHFMVRTKEENGEEEG